jgi:hypothetical protein
MGRGSSAELADLFKPQRHQGHKGFKGLKELAARLDQKPPKINGFIIFVSLAPLW